MSLAYPSGEGGGGGNFPFNLFLSAVALCWGRRRRWGRSAPCGRSSPFFVVVLFGSNLPSPFSYTQARGELRSSALLFIGGVYISARAMHVPKFDMLWLNLSPIPVGRRGVISSFKLFLPVFDTRTGERRESAPCGPLLLCSIPSALSSGWPWNVGGGLSRLDG